MDWSNKRKFIFRCKECQSIIESEFENKKEIKNILNNKIELICPCKGRAVVLLD